MVNIHTDTRTRQIKQKKEQNNGSHPEKTR